MLSEDRKVILFYWKSNIVLHQVTDTVIDVIVNVTVSDNVTGNVTSKVACERFKMSNV